MEKSQKVTLLATIIIAGFALAVIFHYALGFYAHLEYPFNTFLFKSSDVFGDFTGMMPLVTDLAPFKAANLWVNYFPLAYIFLFPFSLIKNPLIAYLIFLSIFWAYWIHTNVKNFKCENLNPLLNFQNIFILSFLSYPYLVILDRGNFDLILFVLMSAFVFSVKSKKYLKSASLLAVVNAIKPFYLIFLALFLFQKKYKEFFLSLIISFLLIIGSFMVLHGSFWDQITVFITNLMLFKQRFVFNIESGLSNDSSLFMSLKYIVFHILALPSSYINTFVKFYNALNIIMTLIILFFTWKEKVFWKRISLLTFYSILAPYVAFDYKLIFLFIPIGLFVQAKEKTKFDLIYTILFALLLIPKRFILVWNPGNIFKWFSLSLVANPLIMLIFIGLIISEQFLCYKEIKVKN